MEVSINKFRTQPGRYIELAETGAEIVITSYGKQKARIVPMTTPIDTEKGKLSNPPCSKQGFLFGIWADRNDIENVDAYVASMRKVRSFDY